MTNLLRYMKEKSNYNTKEEAVEFLGNETNFTYEECSKANDFHIRLNKKNSYTIPICQLQVTLKESAHLRCWLFQKFHSNKLHDNLE